MKPVIIFLLLGILFADPTFAERADRDKPVHLESDRATVENTGRSGNKNRVSIFTGNVVLTQGTMIIRSDKMVIEEDSNGFQNFTAYGNLVSYRQKMDNKNEYVEGWGERMKFDNRAKKVEFFNQARLRRGADEVHGEYISYESETEFFKVNNQGGNNPKKRVHAVIQPKNKNQE
ncbi:MAG: lipopolysaccharide transport periplasmic protein LptA [Nitrosomonadaceae bacterium]|nr:lipopolysaccharide transport periplasmic protein LptA [Nitrosomonadaceae bacterium]|tara:strand:- start:402 stop:926 length:525 start_codon:yes stop_codon:yes gene_type:complete